MSLHKIGLKVVSTTFVLLFFFFQLGFTPSKTEQPLQGMKLQEKEAQKRLKHTGELFRKNLQLTDVC